MNIRERIGAVNVTRPDAAGAGDSTDGVVSAQGAQRRLFLDAYALTASTISSAAAGLITYILSARLFPQDVVGQAAAITSAMLLLSGVSQLDLTNALHRYLPGSGRSAKTLILWSYVTVVIVSLMTTFMFVLFFGRSMFGDDRIAPAFWFAGAVALWSIFSLQDQVLMGLGSALLVPLENTVFGLIRIALLVAFIGRGAYAILATWILPVMLLLAVVSFLIATRVFPAHVRRSADSPTSWDFHTVSRFVAGSYVGGLTTLVTINLLPILVVAHLGRATGAYFYMAWVIASNIDLVASNFGISLVVQGSMNPGHTPQLLRAALRRQVTLLGPPIVVIIIFAHPILSIVFGGNYAAASSTMLSLLAAALLPRILWGLYLPAARLAGRVKTMAVTQVFSSILILVFTCVGLYGWGLKGIGAGYLIGHTIIALVLAPKLWKLFQIPTQEVDAQPSASGGTA